jgi:hypothetical protein
MNKVNKMIQQIVEAYERFQFWPHDSLALSPKACQKANVRFYMPFPAIRCSFPACNKEFVPIRRQQKFCCQKHRIADYWLKHETIKKHSNEPHINPGN